MPVSDRRSGETEPGENQPMVFEHVTAAQRVVFGSGKAIALTTGLPLIAAPTTCAGSGVDPAIVSTAVRQG